jgi:hypothetical protein
MLRLITVTLFTVIAIPGLTQVDNVGSGQALYFDGVDDYVDLGDIFDDVTFPFSVSAWVYIDPSYTGSCPILTSQDDDRLYNGFWLAMSYQHMWLGVGDARGENHIAYRSGRQGYFPESVAGRWVQVTAVARGERDMDLYLNGMSLVTSSYGASTEPMHAASPGTTAVVGRTVSNGIYYYHHGAIDDVRVYNTALSATQVRQFMCLRPKGTGIPKLGYWSFDETTGAQANDTSGKNQHGTIHGASHDFSHAPLGDISVVTYPVPANTAVAFSSADHHVQVNTATAVEGLHIYQVDKAPSQTDGLPAAQQQQQSYLGVFIASSTVPRSFQVVDALYGAACAQFTRPGNATATWVQRPNLSGLTDRVEFIRGGTNLLPAIELGADVKLCNHSYYDLSVTVPAVGNATVLWSTGETTPAIRVTRSGLYRVEMQGECNSVRDSLQIILATTPPPFSLGNDSTFCLFTPRQLKPSIDAAGYELQWHDGSKEPSLQVSDFGSYWLRLSNACGTSSDTVKFSRADLTGYALPNVITPGNNDGLNQTFQVHSMLQGWPFSVFNRWGREVYNTPAYYNQWDGADLASGVYYYRLVSPCMGELRGAVSILR